MNTHFKPNNRISGNSFAEAIETDTLPQDDKHPGLLLSTYDQDELIARQTYLAQIEQIRISEIAAQERKAYADSLVDQFELTGSNLPADANPRQLHLF